MSRPIVRSLSVPPAQDKGELRTKLYRAGSLVKSGDFEQADAVFRALIEVYPKHADVWHQYGICALQQNANDTAEMLLRQALSLDATHAHAWSNLGVALRRQNRLEEAIKCYRQAVKLKPDEAGFNANLANGLKAAGDDEAAVRYYRESIRHDPKQPLIYAAMGRALFAQRRFVEASIAFRDAVRYQPENEEFYGWLGNALLEIGHLDDALDAYENALRIKPDYTQILLNMGVLSRQRGNMEKAAQYYRRVLALDPSMVSAWHSLAQVRKFSADSAQDQQDIADIEVALQRKDLTTVARRDLHYALGKAYHECKKSEEAFGHYLEANAIHRKMLNPEPAAYGQYIGALMHVFDQKFFARFQGIGNPDERPVFIVGMPRSGTTLTEQILASHSQVFGAGELEILNHVQIDMPKRLGAKEPFPLCVSQLSDEHVRGLAEYYLARSSSRAGDEVRIIDKMPANYHFLGLIAVMFPNARIIHCVRDPRDTGLSIFFQRFVTGNGLAFSLEDIGYWFRQHWRIMRYWKEVLPLDIHEVRYEETIANMEGTARRLIDLLGLEWEPECLDFHTTKRRVETASSWQVRQPLYTTSVSRWKRYEKQLQPMIRALGEEKDWW